MLAFNLFWTCSNVIFHVTIGILIAVVLNTPGLRFRGFYRAIFILPIVVPTLVVATVWRNMFDTDYGAINQGLAALGGLFGVTPDHFHIRWIDQIDPPIPGIPLPLSYFALLITNIWLGWPFMTIVATGALQSISKEYYEAASIDGASGPQQFFRITLPLLRPAMIPAAMYGLSVTVLFPLVWVVSMSLDPRNISRPTELTLIPPGASLQAYQEVIDRPTSNPVSLIQLAFNSFGLAVGVSLGSLGLGVLAAYAFSRFHFPARRALMIAIVAVLMVPSVAALAPLFVFLNKIQISSGDFSFNLRNSLLGVGLALTSGALPFAIWNLKGYIDTIPKELEEAASLDGASPTQTFLRIMLPLATPALAVTAFLGFLTGWTEFVMSWQFLTNPENFTLAMALWNITGQYAGNTPWSKFSAMAIIVALPVSVVYLSLQKYIVGGLTVGGVKG